MSVNNKQQQTAQTITDNIKSNGRQAITGDLLQQTLLLLNKDYFAGEVAGSFGVPMSEVEEAVTVLRPAGNFRRFLAEWYAGSFDNTYTAILNAGGAACAYLHLQAGVYLGENAINCTFILNTANSIYSFTVMPEASDFEDSYIPAETVKRLGGPRTISLHLPAESTTYSSRAAMLAALGITAEQLAEICAGGYVYACSQQDEKYLPFMAIYAEEFVFGYSHSNGEELYTVNLNMNTISVNVI